MSAPDALLGVAWLGAVVSALGFGAVRVRRRLTPGLDGAPARLAEVVLGLGALVLVPELLGAVGLFRSLPVLLALVGTGIAAGVVASRPGTARAAPTEVARDAPTEVARDAAPAPRPRSRLDLVVTGGAVLLAAAVSAQWMGHVVAAYTASSAGIWDGDSLWYHLPFATHFLQTGWVTRPLFTNADTLVTYFPANSEVVLGTVMLPFRRDVLVPLVNLGWLALVFLAAWCLGRRWGSPAVALAGAAVAMSLPVMSATQAGTARNDVMGVALFLSAAALVAHADWDRNTMAVAGLAAGLALGVKLSTVIPVALLAVAIVVAAPRARRWAAIVPWLAAIGVSGCFWYVRNLVLVGNPVPTVELSLGPVHLPAVFAESIDDTAVVDRFGEAGAVGRVLRPGLAEGFGDLWWLLLLVVGALGTWALLRGRDRVVRALGGVVLAGAVGYVMMPNGSPFADTPLGAANFMLNLRYALPVLTLALVLVAAVPAVREPRIAGAVIGGWALVAVSTLGDRHLADRWEWRVTDGQALAGIVLVALLAGVVLAVTVARRWRRVVIPLAVVLAAVVVVGGFFVQREYAERRYRAGRSGAEARSSVVWPWAQDLRDDRVGVVGTVLQYPFAGPDLRATVRYVGVRTGDGGFRPVRSCRELREQLSDGRYRFLVASHDFFGSNVREIEQIGKWVASVPGVTTVRATPTVWVYEFSSPPDPRACP